MSDDAETRLLRALIERPERTYLWGKPYTVTPRLIAKAFGDGRKLVCITPIDGRPAYFVARIDSSITDLAAPFPPNYPEEFALLDAITLAQEEEYYDNEDDDGNRERRGFPWVDWGDGSAWGEPFPVEKWKPTPWPRTGRQRTRALWARRGRR